MAKGLTRRQEAILKFIVESIRDHGYPPTIAEIGVEFGISSTNGVNDHLIALEKKGYITRNSKARGIHVTDKAAAGLYESRVGVVPLLGRVAAGSPNLAEENVEDFVPVSADMARRARYCLRVHGDSMIEDGILDGDIVIVEDRKELKQGDVVVALVGDEATVKHFHPRGELIELRPANQSMTPLLVPAAEVQIQGVVVGLQRRY
jgi:repressor LexA